VVDLGDVLADLRDEAAELDRLVAGLTPQQWALPTPAPGWTVAHQIAHLCWTDNQVSAAVTDPDGFLAGLAEILTDPAHFVDRGAQETLTEPAELLRRWRDSRTRVSQVLAGMAPGLRHPWFGTQLSAVSSATARLMETWAHGEDVAGALGVARVPTRRLRHVAFLGYRTLGHSFATHGRAAPEEPVYLELTGPDGDTWAYGPADARDRVVGPALDFCLLVTQRINRADTLLVATGPVAREWLEIAQAFAGPPGPGRPSASTVDPPHRTSSVDGDEVGGDEVDDGEVDGGERHGSEVGGG
jgi:uncharacterized protein (TIGR03084 family)